MGVIIRDSPLKEKIIYSMLTQQVNMKKIYILIGSLVIILAVVLIGNFVLQYKPTSISDKKEQGCINSGGTISTAMCCKSVSDFSNTCLIGACGCAPEHSHQVKVCNCGLNKCFDGSRCVGR